MISYLEGTIQSKTSDSVVLLTTGGVGYEVQLTPARALEQQVGTPLSLHTFLRVTDAAHTLYGFFTLEEKSFFELLITVSGVGPKSAMNILALGSIDEISSAIARKDVTYLTAVQGMGKKTAERLVVELQQKVGSPSGLIQDIGESTVLSEVIDALVGMGYQKGEAVEVVKQLDVLDRKTEELLREALKRLA